MASIISDDGTTVDTGTCAKVEFIPSGNVVPPKKAVLDNGPKNVSSIAGVNTLRAETGNGNGNTGWVLVRPVGALGVNHDAYVQLSKVSSVTYSQNGQIAVLKSAAGDLGEVFDPAALAAVKALFPFP